MEVYVSENAIDYTIELKHCYQVFFNEPRLPTNKEIDESRKSNPGLYEKILAQSKTIKPIPEGVNLNKIL